MQACKVAAIGPVRIEAIRRFRPEKPEGIVTASFDEPTTIGVSKSAHAKLKRLKEDGLFEEMSDAYRFAIALALATDASKVVTNRQTFLNVGSLDPDRKVYEVVKELRDSQEEPVYRTAERYAEWGIEELATLAVSGEISFTDIFGRVEKKRGE